MAELFENIKQGVGQGISIISVKSKEVIESIKLKGQIGTLRSQIKSDIYELGNIVYTMFKNDNLNIDRAKDKYLRITELEEQIKNKEEELNHIHLKAQEQLGKEIIIGKCECGASIIANTKFCGKCGKKV